MRYVFKHKDGDKYGQWIFSEEHKGWRWFESQKYPVLLYKFACGLDVKSACLSVGPQSLRGIDVAEKVAKDYTLEIWEGM